MYSITSESSLASVRAIWEEAKAIKEEMGTWEPFQVCLLGTMADLADQREVSKEEGESCAKGMGGAFRECSAKTRVNIDEPFDELVKKIKTYRDNERIRFEQLKKEAEKKKGKKPSALKRLFSSSK
jgi:GTPase KRas protein